VDAINHNNRKTKLVMFVRMKREKKCDLIF